jgi:hypothetical protein
MSKVPSSYKSKTSALLQLYFIWLTIIIKKKNPLPKSKLPFVCNEVHTPINIGADNEENIPRGKVH